MYEAFLRRVIPRFFEEIPAENLPENIYYQQDGAPAHKTRRCLALLQQRYPGRVISIGGNIAWPPRSPDLTPLDFFLWGHIKSIVYTTPPTTVEDMQERIINALQTITPEILQNVRRSFSKRIRLLIDTEGRHVENLYKHNN